MILCLSNSSFKKVQLSGDASLFHLLFDLGPPFYISDCYIMCLMSSFCLKMCYRSSLILLLIPVPAVLILFRTWFMGNNAVTFMHEISDK